MNFETYTAITFKIFFLNILRISLSLLKQLGMIRAMYTTLGYIIVTLQNLFLSL